MDYVDKLNKYVDGCRSSVETVSNIISNKDLDITLTMAEKFDHLFKREFIKVDENEKKKRLFKRNSFKGKSMTAFVAQMFYMILKTSDAYNFEVLQKVIQKITKISARKKYALKKLTFEVAEHENQYILKVTQEGEEPLSYCIENKETYVACLANLLSLCFGKTNNRMMAGYYKTYLQHEIMKIESDTEITPYVEWAPNLRLCDYFEPVVEKEDKEEKRAIPAFLTSKMDLAPYERIIAISNELDAGRKQKTDSAREQKKRADDFYESTFVSAMGIMTHNGNPKESES